MNEEERFRSGRLCWWVANVPIASYLLTRKCSAGGSVVYARWIWQRCPSP